MNKGKILISIGVILTFVGIMDSFTICYHIQCDEIESSIVWDIFFNTLIFSDFWFTYPGIIISIIGLISIFKQKKKIPSHLQANKIIAEKPVRKGLLKRGSILLAISGGIFFVAFVLFAFHAILFMGTWEKLNLEEGQQGVLELISNEVPQIILIDLAFIGFLVLGIIIAITGAMYWYQERKQENSLNN